jgi:hypothetical protein
LLISSIGSLTAREANMAWHPTKHDIVVPCIGMRQSADNMSCEWVVRHVSKKTVYGAKKIQAKSNSVSGFDE